LIVSFWRFLFVASRDEIEGSETVVFFYAPFKPRWWFVGVSGFLGLCFAPFRSRGKRPGAGRLREENLMKYPIPWIC